MPSWRRNSWPPLGVMPSASTIGSSGSASLNLRITWAARSGIAISTSASMPPAWAWITTLEMYWPAGQPVHSTAYCDCDWLNLSKSAFQPSFSPGWNCSQLITLSVLRSAPKARRPRSGAATRPPARAVAPRQDVAARRRQACRTVGMRHRDPPRSGPALRRATGCKPGLVLLFTIVRLESGRESVNPPALLDPALGRFHLRSICARKGYPTGLTVAVSSALNAITSHIVGLRDASAGHHVPEMLVEAPVLKHDPYPGPDLDEAASGWLQPNRGARGIEVAAPH